MTTLLRASLIAGALFTAGSALAQQSSVPPRSITVEGHADIDVEPDLARISVGVTTRAPTPAAAIDQNSAAARKVIDAARKAGIEPKDIRTGTLSLQQAFKNVRDAGGNFEQRPDGFSVTNSVTLQVRELPKLGPVLRQVVEEGANTIDNLSFAVSDRKKIDDDLRKEAVLDARRRAEILVQTAGAKLGDVRTINETSRGGGPRPMQMSEMRLAAAPKADVPVSAGSLTFSSSVTVTWTLD